MLFFFMLLVGLTCKVFGDRNRLSPKQCTSTADCDTTIGQRCYWLYEGCAKGQCMCNPTSVSADITGYCASNKRGGDKCVVFDECQGGMKCVDGTCKCQTGEMTDDKLYCLQNDERILGQQCSHSIHQCLQKTGFYYSKSDVYCSSTMGLCDCDDGYEREGLTCRRLDIGEYGCKRSHHCDGGAVCHRGQCICPTNYSLVTRGAKCALRGAVTDLPEGAACDEINERFYCAQGLVCHMCPEDKIHRCLRFTSPIELKDDDPGDVTSHQPSLHDRLLYDIITSLTTLAFAVQ